MSRVIALLTMMTLIAVVATVAWTQQADHPVATGESAGREAAAPDAATAASHQEFIKQQFDKLLSKMLDVSIHLEKSNPEVSKVLRRAANHAKEVALSGDMDKVIEAVKNDLDATDKEYTVIAELKKVLDILEEKAPPAPNALEPILAKVVQLKNDEIREAARSAIAKEAPAIRQELANLDQRLADITAEQEKNLADAAKLQAGDDALRKLAEMRARLQAMIEKQDALRIAVVSVVTNQEMAKLAVQGEQQKNLGEQASQVAKDIESAASDPKLREGLRNAGVDGKALASAAKSTAKASTGMNQAGQYLGKTDPDTAAKHQDQALFDLRKAMESLDGALAQASGHTPSGKLGQNERDLSARTRQLVKDINALADKTGTPTNTDKLGKAADEMGQASDKLIAQKPRDSVSNQQRALDYLKGKTPDPLGQLRRRIQDKLNEDPADAPKQQARIAGELDKLSKLMNQKSPDQPDGIPGKDKVADAGKDAGQATNHLSQGRPSDANEEQNKTIKNLGQAEIILLNLINGGNQAIRQEKLATLTEKLEDMLARQRVITSGTALVDSKRDANGSLHRPEELALQNLSHDEGVLADDSKKVTKLLEDDRTTMVFPEVMKEVESDLRDLQSMLNAQQTDPLTQAVQGSVERNLQELVDALKKEMGHPFGKTPPPPPSEPRPGDPRPPPKPKLVPPTAELKMLKQLQAEVNRRTGMIALQVQRNALTPSQIEEQHRKLAQNQRKIETLAREIKGMLQCGGSVK